METMEDLRLRRFKLRVTKREMARRLGCSEPWLNLLELGHYHGPAREKWAEAYRRELEKIISEVKNDTDE